MNFDDANFIIPCGTWGSNNCSSFSVIFTCSKGTDLFWTQCHAWWTFGNANSWVFSRNVYRWPLCIRIMFLLNTHKRDTHELGGEGWGEVWSVQRERGREIKFIGLFENRGHRGPYSSYKPFNHNLYIGIIIFPHIDNPQYTGYDLPKKIPNKIISEKVRAPLIWQIIGEKDSGSVYMWI